MNSWRRDFHEGDLFPEQVFCFGRILSWPSGSALESYAMLRFPSSRMEMQPSYSSSRRELHRREFLIFVAFGVVGWHWKFGAIWTQRGIE